MGRSARLAEVPSEVLDLGTIADAAYIDAFEVAVAPDGSATPEDWARAVFEGAPAPLRWLVRGGWRVALGFRLGPARSPDYILGWKIVARGVDWLRIEQHSSLMTAQLVFWNRDGKLVQATFVGYRRRLAGWIWPPVSVTHRRVVPFFLHHAAKRQAASVSGSGR